MEVPIIVAPLHLLKIHLEQCFSLVNEYNWKCWKHQHQTEAGESFEPVCTLMSDAADAASLSLHYRHGHEVRKTKTGLDQSGSLGAWHIQWHSQFKHIQLTDKHALCFPYKSATTHT